MTSNQQHKDSTMFRDLTSYAHAYSDCNGFVDASDFLSMAINYAIEREMDAEANEFEWVDMDGPLGDDDTPEYKAWAAARVDAMALQAKVMDDMEKGNVLWAW